MIRDDQPSIVDADLNRQFFTFRRRSSVRSSTASGTRPDNGYAERFKHTIEPFLNVDADLVDRQLRSHRPDRRHRHDRRRHDAVSPTASTTASTRSGGRGRAAGQAHEIFDVDAVADLLHRRSGRRSTIRSIRPAPAAAPSNFLAARRSSVRAHADQRVQRDGARRVRQPLPRAAHHLGQRQLQLDQPAADDGELEQQALHRGACRLQRSGRLSITPSTRRPTCTRATTVRRHLFVQLRRAALDAAAAAHVGVLQRAVLRHRVRVSDLQLRQRTRSRRFPSDHRFFLSFTLAGLGNFSPFNGAMGGVPR